MGTIKTLILLGKPGSGKGTLARELVTRRAWHSCGSGDFFRELGARDDDLGQRVRAIYDTGGFLPDWFITRLLVGEMMSLDPLRGVVFDGFCRNLIQANEMDEVLWWFERPYLAVNLEVSDETVVRRIAQRNAMTSRSDSDSQEKVAKRLADYRKKSAPALKIFGSKGILQQIDAEGTPESVYEAVHTLL